MTTITLLLHLAPSTLLRPILLDWSVNRFDVSYRRHVHAKVGALASK